MQIRIHKSSVSLVNRIYILDCLPEEESTSVRADQAGMLDNILTLREFNLEDSRAALSVHACRDRERLICALGQIREDARGGARPLVFIHAHGHRQHGLGVASGEYLGWVEYLIQLEAIVQVSSGELTVVASFCYSMAAVSQWEKKGRLPYAFYYGYDHEVTAGTIQDESQALYQSFFMNGGRDALLGSPSLRCHSEYDHALPALASTCLLAVAPEKLAGIVPSLSKQRLRSTIEARDARSGIPLSGARKRINGACQSKELIEMVASEYMHDTERRAVVVEAFWNACQSVGSGRAP